MTPPTHPGHQLDQVYSEIKNMGQFNMFREKVINHPKLIEVGVAKYLKVSECPPLPIQVDRWTARSRTWGSSTCSGRRLSTTHNFLRLEKPST